MRCPSKTSVIRRCSRSQTVKSGPVQSEPARIFVEVVAPPGLPIDSKRKLMRGLTEVAGSAYGLTDFRNVLVSLDEHKVEDFAANGFLQTENPEMAPFAAALQRK